MIPTFKISQPSPPAPTQSTRQSSEAKNSLRSDEGSNPGPACQCEVNINLVMNVDHQPPSMNVSRS